MRATLQGVELFYMTHGRGIPVLLAHDGPGLDHTIFRPWLDGLADSASLNYVDLRGNGRSRGHTTLTNVSVDTWADDLEALRTHLQHDRVVILGHGFGGFVAQHFALRYPERAAGLILCAATAALDYPQEMLVNAQAHCSPTQLSSVITLLSRPVADDATFRQLYRDILPTHFYRHDPRVAGAMDEVLSYSAAAYNHGSFTLMPGLNTLASLPSIKVPTLVLVGKHDWLMPPAQGAGRLHKHLPDSELVVFEESGHFPFVEEPVAFCNVVRRFLRQRVRP